MYYVFIGMWLGCVIVGTFSISRGFVVSSLILSGVRVTIQSLFVLTSENSVTYL